MSKVKYNTSIDSKARRKTIVKVLLKIAVIFIAAFKYIIPHAELSERDKAKIRRLYK